LSMRTVASSLVVVPRSSAGSYSFAAIWTRGDVIRLKPEATRTSIEGRRSVRCVTLARGHAPVVVHVDSRIIQTRKGCRGGGVTRPHCDQHFSVGTQGPVCESARWPCGRLAVHPPARWIIHISEPGADRTVPLKLDNEHLRLGNKGCGVSDRARSACWWWCKDDHGTETERRVGCCARIVGGTAVRIIRAGNRIGQSLGPGTAELSPTLFVRQRN